MPGTSCPADAPEPVWRPKRGQPAGDAPAERPVRRNPREWLLGLGKGHRTLVVALAATFLPSIPFFIIASKEAVVPREPPTGLEVAPDTVEGALQPLDALPGAGARPERSEPRRKDLALALLQKISSRSFQSREDVATGRFLRHF